MEFPSRFICAGPAFSTLESFVPAPYFRKTFEVSDVTAPCNILVTGLGFYRIWVNGREITKGLLAPYISNPDHFVYFDEYDLSPYLVKGENALGFQLGNGMRNAPGGAIWDFDDASFRGAPCLSFALEYEGGRLEADRSVKTAPNFIEKLTFAKGIFDSPEGPVTVEWNRQTDCSIRLQVSAPEGVQVRTALPARWSPVGELPEAREYDVILIKK